eukprot:tig00001333_g8195.t1
MQRQRRTEVTAEAEGEKQEKPAAAASSSRNPNCRVVVITSGKGGVGKTTTTANLGMALARLGRQVCVLDADFGLRNLDLLLGLENRVVYTISDVLAGSCRLEQALVKDKRVTGLSLLPAAQNRTKEDVNSDQMMKVVDGLSEKFEYIIIDCPAGIEGGFQNAIAAAKEAVLVTTPEIAAVRDADRVVGLLEAYGINSINLIVNRLRPGMVQANDMMSVADVVEILAVPLIGVIPEDEKIIVSTNRGEPLVLDEKLSLPGLAFENVARRLEGEDVDFIDLETPYTSLFSKIKRLFSKSY